MEEMFSTYICTRTYMEKAQLRVSSLEYLFNVFFINKRKKQPP